MDQSISYTKEGLLKIINALPLSITVIDKNRAVALANHNTYLFVNKFLFYTVLKFQKFLVESYLFVPV